MPCTPSCGTATTWPTIRRRGRSCPARCCGSGERPLKRRSRRAGAFGGAERRWRDRSARPARSCRPWCRRSASSRSRRNRSWPCWTAWRWIWSRGSTRRSTNWPSTASAWRRPSAWPVFTSGAFGATSPSPAPPWTATSRGQPHAGLALQLTNILRDLSEDARRGRVYLPLEDIRACGYSAEELQQRRGESAVPAADGNGNRSGRAVLS